MNLSMIEAAKYGLPIISSNCSLSHKDIIIHKKNGFLFDIKFKEQFLNYLTILIKSEKKREKFGKASIKFVIKKFNNKNILKRWEKLLN